MANSEEVKLTQIIPVLAVIVFSLYFWAKYGLSLAIMCFIFGLGIVGAVIKGLNPPKCEICGIQLKNKAYKWTIDGEMKRICPNCNRNLERKKSKEAIKKIGL